MEVKACSSINEKLDAVSIGQSKCTIYKVHRHLREVNPKAYEPEIIAIGPYHRNTKDDLKMMEDHKLRYFNLLLERIDKNVENFVSTFALLESSARKSYAEPISLDKAEFIEMLILDGCFIIEFVEKWFVPYSGERDDPIFDLPWIIDSLQRDLILFENQIPFFILCELSDFIYGPDYHLHLINALLSFFEGMYPLAGVVELGSRDVSSHYIHLLDLIHRKWHPVLNPSSGEEKRMQCPTRFGIKHLLNWCAALPSNSSEEERMKWIESATRLEEANVLFGRNKEAKNMFELDFKNGTILMPPLTIDDGTESLFRNLMAYEQYFDSPSSLRYMSDYVHLLDCLIDSSKDVQILRHNGIIKSWLGDEEVVAKIINKLCDSTFGPDARFIYSRIFNIVNGHCRKRRNRWMAKLRRNYLNSPWAIISIIAATILLLLTVIQTVFGLLQVV